MLKLLMNEKRDDLKENFLEVEVVEPSMENEYQNLNLFERLLVESMHNHLHQYKKENYHFLDDYMQDGNLNLKKYKLIEHEF